MPFWIVESSFHSKVLEDGLFSINPHDPDDLWMRSLIIFLIIEYGFFILRKIDKERLLKNIVEVYKALNKAKNHILNIFLQNMFVFKLEADNSTDFDENIQKLYYENLNQTKVAIKELEGIVEPKKEAIESRLQL